MTDHHRSFNDCLHAETRARRARRDADIELVTLRSTLATDVDAAVEAFNLSGDCRFTCHDVITKVSIIDDPDGEPDVAVTLTVGHLADRATGHRLMPREAWALDDAALTGAFRRWLDAGLSWTKRCRLNVFLPDDYDPMSADPEL
jgi:hypothetical protein